MALDDFYVKYPSYATRAELSVRDSRGDLFTAAKTTEELMDKNGQVQAEAIISPQTSPEAEIFAGIAERNSIPILFSSATSPASSSSQSRLFVRTAPNISSLAPPIAAIFEAFGWRAATLLHEDSPYGIGFLSALVHAFQGSCSLTDSVAVPVDATDSRLDKALYSIMIVPTRVCIVHMRPALAARLFRRATAAMITGRYVWITTAGVGNAADNLPAHGDIDDVQGLVSLLPYVQATDQVRNFSRRFKVRFRQENPGLEHDDLNVPVSLMWLYDTAWAAAAAAEVSFLTPPLTLLDALLITKFDGLTGRFRLVDGQRQVSAYEIVNIIGQGSRTVGFWTPESGISTSLYPNSARKELKQILWPSEMSGIPVGWSLSPNGRVLRVAVPVKSGFPQLAGTSSDPTRGGRDTVSGYCIDVFDAAMKRLNYPVHYIYSMCQLTLA
ncbi:glutamate receptor 2.8-like [Triticum dicoccoides]|uniref:glutamate receptor 2.8-like n=1 Tax=Triticum dicoccoides TaxID=85692 RepID=UPI001890CBDF|nr:glutamate receptor 2.8-like [Triticum dicoccoides]